MVLCQQVPSRFRHQLKYKSSSSLWPVFHPLVQFWSLLLALILLCLVQWNPMRWLPLLEDSSVWSCPPLSDSLVKTSRHWEILTEGKAKGQKWPLSSLFCSLQLLVSQHFDIFLWFEVILFLYCSSLNPFQVYIKVKWFILASLKQ